MFAKQLISINTITRTVCIWSKINTFFLSASRETFRSFLPTPKDQVQMKHDPHLLEKSCCLLLLAFFFPWNCNLSVTCKHYLKFTSFYSWTAFLLSVQLGVLLLFLALSSLFNLEEFGWARYFPDDFNNIKLGVQGIELWQQLVQTNLKAWIYFFFPFSHQDLQSVSSGSHRVHYQVTLTWLSKLNVSFGLESTSSLERGFKLRT